jgi:hypothetical protein
MYGFNIANFSSHLHKYGTIQTNKFMVEIPSPSILAGSSVPTEVMLNRANAIKIPGVSFDTQNVLRYGMGPQQKFPTNVNFSDVDITFIDTVNNDLWKRFTVWMNGIYDFTGQTGGSQAGYQVEYRSYYETDVKIYIFDNEGIQRTAVVLKEAYPVSLTDVSLSWGDNNKLYEFGVRFTFKEWYYSGYNVTEFKSGAKLSPAQTYDVLPPQRSPETPRETPPPRQVPEILPNIPNYTPEAQQLRRGNFGARGRAGGYYSGSPTEPPATP